MSLIVFLLFIVLSIFIRRNNFSYSLILILIFVSFFSQFFVGRVFEYQSVMSIVNCIFICINLFLIVYPWSYSRIRSILIHKPAYFIFFKKILYKVLFFNFILNLFILIIVLIFLPNIVEFKAEQGFLKLYDQIPYFANIFRYAYVSQNLGYLAIPIFFHHLGRSEYSKYLIALLWSSSTLLSGFAFYSRAQIFTYVLVFVVYFFLVKNSLPYEIRLKTLSFLKKATVIIFALFFIITYLRFTGMDYYSDRIPSKSIIMNPVLFSLVDYASQSFSNGLSQMENYNSSKNLMGEQLFRDVYQVLNFFGFANWDSEMSQLKIDEAYNYDGGAFNGYTCVLLFNFGYMLTFFISLIYCLVVIKYLKNKNVILLESNFKLILLLFIPIVSIFYPGFALLYFPLTFIIITNILFFFKSLLKNSIAIKRKFT